MRDWHSFLFGDNIDTFDSIVWNGSWVDSSIRRGFKRFGLVLPILRREYGDGALIDIIASIAGSVCPRSITDEYDTEAVDEDEARVHAYAIRNSVDDEHRENMDTAHACAMEVLDGYTPTGQSRLEWWNSYFYELFTFFVVGVLEDMGIDAYQCGEPRVVEAVETPIAKVVSDRRHVYLMESDSGKGPKYYKIGISKDPEKRCRDIGRHMPLRPRVVISAESATARTTESMLHCRYGDQRSHGEWFVFTNDELVDLIDTFKEGF